jgi:hypothetical protein
MTQAVTRKSRNLVGTLLILALLVAYPLAIAALGGDWLAALPGWASIPVFAVLGLLWCVPAAIVIRWMARPD